ncbi:PAS domain S-box protein [Chitinophaga nivalis]|uniref:histidine kinase n=1 Tax=Chitinophaga nivalis TaxID=2991709 RepID=A0ABT3IUV3_9BACT|nr:PAS domain S-box protein [Chitinophaga nivalis]MCW3462570.1 PAS domain S-box protein [Chitinophaga nivalis]MCW3487739.1 PAS domain S-box protein [Chitinophaga nivalis]
MKKIANTVIVLVVVVLITLCVFVFYAWMVQKRTRDAATSIKNSNLIIDKARSIAALDNSYTTSIRDMLLMDQQKLPPLGFQPPDSMQRALHQLMQMVSLSPPSQKVLLSIQHILREKIAYNQEILQTATTNLPKARQLITAPKGQQLRLRLQQLVSTFLETERTLLIQSIDKDAYYTRYSFWSMVLASLLILILLGGEARYIFRLFEKLRNWSNQLQKSEQSFKRLTEEMEPILFTTDTNGLFTYVSKGVADITGYSHTALIGKHYSLFLEEDIFENLDTFYRQQVEEGQDYSSREFEIITKTGAKRWVEQLTSIVRREDGKLKEFQCIVRDIDSEKRNDATVEYLQKRLEAIIDFMPSMMFVKDMPGKYLLVNNRFTEIMQVDKDDIIGKTDAELSHHTWVARYAELDRQVMSTGNRFKMDDTIEVKDKTYHFLITKFPLRNNAGEMIGVCGIGQDLTEKVNYIAGIEKANKIAKEAVNSQEIFLANMSHEIRTPMNGIIGMTNLLIQQQQLTPTQIDYVMGIKTSASNLLVIINDILDFSKIKAGKLQLLHEPFELFEVINQVLFPLKLQAEQKGVSFYQEIDDNIPAYLLGDEVRLNQILVNIVENAIKFTVAGSIRVKICLAGEDKDRSTIRIGFTVKDTGIGIPPEKQASIFESFSQTHTGSSRKFGGTGLGLAICKHLIALQDGIIRVESNINEGSVFYFELPFTKDLFATQQKKDPQKHATQDKALAGKLILVVEDNDINQQVAFHTLRNAGARTDVVSDGETALQMLRHKTYDCIIMDIQMPGMDGYQTTRAMRQQGITASIIAMTASAIKGEKERCLEAGMNDYISKPFEPEELFYKIQKGMGEEVADYVARPVAANASQGPVNFNTVYKIMSGNSENIRVLLEDLLRSVPVKFAELYAAIREENWNQAFIIAHQLKGNLDIVGMREAVTIAHSIERDATLTENLDTLPARLEELIATYNKYAPLIEEHIMAC